MTRDKQTHFMVDIETLATGRDAAITTIGACTFDVDGDIGHTFSALIDLEASKSPGVIDPATIYWWLQRDKEAQLAMVPTSFSDDQPLEQTLVKFHRWVYLTASGTTPVLWSNGPMFDERILREACKRTDVPFHFHFRDSRDCRTIFALRPDSLDKPPRQGTHHNALDDAIYQAESIAMILRERGLPLR